MIIKFKRDVFYNSNRADVFDEDGDLICWCQNDFSYKNRKHFYDSSDNEIGYAQLNLKDRMISIYGNTGVPYGYINLGDVIHHVSFGEWDIIEDDNYRIVDKDYEEIMHIEENDEFIEMHIAHNKDDLKCAICLFSMADYINLKGEANQ